MESIIKKGRKSTSISVIMAVYNSEKYLEEAVNSILSQTHEDFEFIVVDDGSTDSSLDILKKFGDKRITLLSQENRGVAVARNTAIAYSNSNYVAVMDSDDIALPNRLEIQLEFLAKKEEIIAVGSYAEAIKADGESIYTIKKPTSPDAIAKMMPSMPFVHPSVTFRKEIFLKVGGYPPNFPPMEDRMIFNRMYQHGKFANIPKVLLKYRFTPTGISKSCKGFKKYLEELVIKDFQGEVITDENLNKLKSLKSNDTPQKRRCNYYKLLAKKYLWNKYCPVRSRKYIKKALSEEPYNFSLELFILYVITFLDKRIIMKAYQLTKS